MTSQISFSAIKLLKGMEGFAFIELGTMEAILIESKLL